MVHFELPHVNVLSKVDLLGKVGELGMRAACSDIGLTESLCYDSPASGAVH